ncbi:MAG: serine/threonine protein kinase [Desulfurococcaceae archaeon]
MASGFRIENSELDGEVHFLLNIDPFIRKALCYPLNTCKDIERRVNALLDDGFIYLLETGVKVPGLRALGKGYSSLVVVANNVRYGIGALKVLRVDSKRDSLLKEALLLKAIQDLSISPKLMLFRDFYVFYELQSPLKCKPYVEILARLILNRSILDLKRSLLNTFKSLYDLDVKKIDHTELNRINGHVLYCDGFIKIMDWESARFTEKPGNLTSFISFLLYRFRLSSELRELLQLRIIKILEALREYKESYSLKSFNKLKEAMSLQDVN